VRRFAFLCLLLLAAGQARAEASDVFEKFAERVVQVRVLEKGSGSKSVIGSGFFVSADGLVITNYHVVSALVFQPSDFVVELHDSAGNALAAKVVDVDVVHDLAVLKSETAPPSFFTLEPIQPSRGARLYSLGNPHDVGFSILEGTYNGIIAESLYEHVHFSGSLNGGVSGGPTLDEKGRVVGINVSSYGDQLSFLVPVKFARELQDRVQATPQREAPLLERVREDLTANQEHVSKLLLDARPAPTRLGPWELPGRWLPQLREWADRSKDNEPTRRYRWTSYGARSEDSIYLSRGDYTGTVALTHMLFEPDGAKRVQLFRQAGQTYFSRQTLSIGEEAEPSPANTRWKCRDAVLKENGTRLKAVICLRAYKQLSGLYEALVRYLALDDPDKTVVGELTLTGFSVANVEAISRRFLGAVAWKP
jgi:serine protease Do